MEFAQWFCAAMTSSRVTFGASGRRGRGRRERIHSGRVNHSVAADVGVGVVLVGVIHDTIRAVNDLIRTTSGGACGSLSLRPLLRLPGAT